MGETLSRTKPEQSLQEMKLVELNATLCEAERLQSKFYELWHSSEFLRPPGPSQGVNRDEYYESLKNYCNLFMCNSLQICPLSITDHHGNTQRLKFMKSSVNILDSAIVKDTRLRPSSDGARKEEEEYRERNGETFDHWWMLTNEQKRAMQVQEYENNLWEMTKLNCDYMERSKAL
ncbi:hypothetical protein Y032_0088g2143 [Ancylostoma ceylanicum]|nr:hypothetical protein Y032_0088g2143 [Ancylostoma ceylanicum]